MAQVTRYTFRSPLATKREAIPANRGGWSRNFSLSALDEAMLLALLQAEEEEVTSAPRSKKGGR